MVKSRFVPPASPVKRVWRVSADHPKGQYVDAGAPMAKVQKRLVEPEVTHGGWIESSFELLHGVEVDENADTIPADLMDQWFGDRKD